MSKKNLLSATKIPYTLSHELFLIYHNIDIHRPIVVHWSLR